MPSNPQEAPRGHVCPPSDATHPSDRWESLFVYSFISKFTPLRGKIEGLETPMDFEEALLSREPNPILTQLLCHFILNLRPQTRNLSADQISSTVVSVLSEYLKSSERTIFWNEDLNANVDPFDGLEGGFFGADWDFKLKILRQLVELQLCHSQIIKGTIDRAWGVAQNKHKKKDTATTVPDPVDPNSREMLQLVPIGQDKERKRYWVADGSPRVYVSTNPWRVAATFQSISSTRDEYLAVIAMLKASITPETKKPTKRTRIDIAHQELIDVLESRIDTIDAELARVYKVRRKIQQRQIYLAQAAEVRETRTRRQTRRPDYVYQTVDSEDDGDEYRYVEDEIRDEELLNDEFSNSGEEPFGSRRRRNTVAEPPRRSSRTATANSNGKRGSSTQNGDQWRGERRSSRLGGPTEPHEGREPPLKRARTEDSTTSTGSGDLGSPKIPTNGLKLKSSGAAALRPTEVALEQIAGKKRSKFWVYAVEPNPDTLPPPETTDNTDQSMSNGSGSPPGPRFGYDDFDSNHSRSTSQQDHEMVDGTNSNGQAEKITSMAST